MPKSKKLRKPQKKDCQGKEVQVKKQKQNKKDQDLNNKSTVENDREDDDVKNELALFSAAESGNYTELANLLKLDVSAEINHLVPSLHYAVKQAIMPLQIAAVNGHTECVEILIAHGAKLDAKDKFDCTALHFAAEEGNYLCLKLLLEAGADCNIRSTLPLIKAVPPYPGGTTALHLAATHNHVKCIEELIKFGADCSALDENGHTSLYIAAQAGFRECVLTHLRNAHDSTFISLPSYDTSDTPLHYAVEKRMVECVQELVHLGANVNHINYKGLSPLHLSCRNCVKGSVIHMEILKHLVLGGCNTDVNKISDNGITALFYLANSNCIPVLTFLISHGADVNIKNRNYGLNFLEHQLTYNYSTGLDIINCIINCMPQLPHLNSLNVSFPVVTCHKRHFEFKHGIWRDSVLPENVEFGLLWVDKQVYVEVFNHETMCVQHDKEKLEFDVIPHPMRYPLQQPLLNLLYERVIDELKYRNEDPKNLRNSFLRLTTYQLQTLKVQLWYEQMASTPLPLQHYCRFSIRECMGVSKLKRIRELPLPENLHSYLLCEC